MTRGDFKHYLELVVQETAKMESKHGVVPSAAAGTSQPPEGGVRDPVGVRTKGTGRENEPVGSRGVKRRKCSNCGVVGHRRTRCPNGPPTSANSTQEACNGNAGPGFSNPKVGEVDPSRIGDESSLML
ncbi:hypothetical protein PIB30_023409 [Stylosanthes scabra]|uniref:CCHC-type domain-containing protein n=1 Tax=Stylosanthes scabra TaxID=79078 RepID=A0ABU6XA71_9FABA|nr:hypothetical protein [Stylosanthes scabra]